MKVREVTRIIQHARFTTSERRRLVVSGTLRGAAIGGRHRNAKGEMR